MPHRHPDTAAHPLVLVLAAVGLVLAAGVALQVTQISPGPPTQAQQLVEIESTNNTTQPTSWMQATWHGGQPLRYSQVNLSTFDHAGHEHRQACTTPELDEPACAQAFDASSAWFPNEQLYIPCYGAGSHTVTVTVRGAIVANTAIRCHQAAT